MAALLSRQSVQRGCYMIKFSAPWKTNALLTKCNALKSCGQLLRTAGDHGPRKMYISPTAWRGKIIMRTALFYASLTGIPCALFFWYVSVFIGNAQYSEIPEGYVPYHWEYYKHPVMRFFVKHFCESPQMAYEKAARCVQIEGEKVNQRKVEKEVRKMMRQRGDSVWFSPPTRQPHKSDEDITDY